MDKIDIVSKLYEELKDTINEVAFPNVDRDCVKKAHDLLQQLRNIACGSIAKDR